MGDSCQSNCRRVGSVVFTRGGELQRDGLTAEALVAGAPKGLRELIDRCGGRLALVENRDGLPPPSDAEAHWAARRQRGQELLRSMLPADGASHPVREEALGAAALRAMPAASAMSAASALQGAVGGSAASDVTDEALGAAFSGMLEQMRARGGGQSRLADVLGSLQPPSAGAPLEIELSSAMPDNFSVVDGATPPSPGSSLRLAHATASAVPPRLVISGAVRFVSPTLIWAGGAASRGTHRLKLHGPVMVRGEMRLRSPPGLTLLLRGPLTLTGPLQAHVARAAGVGGGDEWLTEGVLRCALCANEESAAVGEATPEANEATAAAAAATMEALRGAFCELHGASAAEEIERAAGEACAIELSEDSKLEIKEGGALWVDGSAGVAPAAGVPPPAGGASGSALVAAKGRLEAFGYAELQLTGPTALMPTVPRVLAQVVHTG